MTKSTSSSSSRRTLRRSSHWWIAPLLLAAGLQPALNHIRSSLGTTTGVAQARESSRSMHLQLPQQSGTTTGVAQARESLYQKRLRILAAIPHDPTVLINVSSGVMPGSPDVLNLGRRAEPALEQCLANNTDPTVRSNCALMLGALGDRRALPALRTALADWDGNVRFEALSALQTIPDKASYPMVAKLFLRKDEPRQNRYTALSTLGALSSTKAVKLLRRVSVTKPEKDGDPDFRVSAFHALWHSRHLMSPATLASDVGRALRSDNKRLVLAAVEAASILRSPQHVSALIPLMSDSDEEVRNKAVYALGKIGDKRAAAALLHKLPDVREARMLNNIAFALERLDRAKFYQSISKLIEHKQAIIRVNAAFVVGDVKRPEGKQLLSKALKDPSNLVRVNAIVALGKLGDPAGSKLLAPFTKSDNPEIRQEAIFAVHKLGGDKGNALLHRLFQDKKHARARRRAALTLAKLGDRSVQTYVLQRCLDWNQCPTRVTTDFLRSDPSPSVPGRVLLAWSSRERSDLNGLLASLHPRGTKLIARSKLDAAISSGDESAMLNAMALLGRLHDQQVTATLTKRVLADKDTWLRLHAAITLLRIGNNAAVETLRQEIQNLPAEQLPSLVSAMSSITEPAARQALLPTIEAYEKGKDVDFAMASAAIHLAWFPEKAVFRFLDALGSTSGRQRDLAVRYLRRNHTSIVTSLLRRAIAREQRPYVKQALRDMLDHRPG